MIHDQNRKIKWTLKGGTRERERETSKPLAHKLCASSSRRDVKDTQCLYIRYLLPPLKNGEADTIYRIFSLLSHQEREKKMGGFSEYTFHHNGFWLASTEEGVPSLCGRRLGPTLYNNSEEERGDEFSYACPPPSDNIYINAHFIAQLYGMCIYGKSGNSNCFSPHTKLEFSSYPLSRDDYYM